MLRKLQIETTNTCNAHCLFCPHDQIPREQLGHMDMKLFGKILDEAESYPVEHIYPQGTGEPFCDPHFIARLGAIKGAFRPPLKPPTIGIFTNGSLLTEQHIDLLAHIPNLFVVLSLNGMRRATRRNIMGLDDFEQVFTKYQLMRSLGIDVRPSMVCYPTIDISELQEFASLPNVTLIQYQSFAGQSYRYRRRMTTRCRRALNWLTVLKDGQVNLCCFDALGQVNFGNLAVHSIGQVLQGDLRAKYGMAHAQGKGHTMPLCDQCTEGAREGMDAEDACERQAAAGVGG